MITISLCMIVKNEERNLRRCLDSVKNLMDEIIIVDTGSTDRTREVAREYTDRVYEIPWENDFAAARNFSFSKAGGEYIYCADADEYLDEENYEKFRILKEALLPQVEIVQMYYKTPEAVNTVLNAHRELRPKLFRRLRNFTWIHPVHETIRLDPVVFDSEIEICHVPHELHGKRDFAIFAETFAKEGMLEEDLLVMYARELFKCGDREDFIGAEPTFEWALLQAREQEPGAEREILMARALSVLLRSSRLSGKEDRFFAYSMEAAAGTGCSEICCEVGAWFLERKNYGEAVLWYSNGAFVAEPILAAEWGGRVAYEGLVAGYRDWEAAIAEDPKGTLARDAAQRGVTPAQMREWSTDYAKQLAAWKLPEEL